MPKHYGDLLHGIMKSKGINVHLSMNLIEIKPKKQIAIFKNQTNGELKEVPFDLLHVSPPMKVSEGIRNSKVCSKETGLITVNQFTMQHIVYKNIWGCGDATNAPKSRTGAAAVVES